MSFLGTLLSQQFPFCFLFFSALFLLLCQFNCELIHETTKKSGSLKMVEQESLPNYCCCCLVVRLCPTLCNPMAGALQASLFIGFPGQKYWIGLSFPPPGGLSDPGIEPMSPALAGGFFTSVPTRKPLSNYSRGQMQPSACFCK